MNTHLLPPARLNTQLALVRRLLLIVIWAMLTIQNPPAGANSLQPPDVTTLMALLRQVQMVEVQYQETVESSLIHTAISTRGRLIYHTPDRIQRISDQGDGFILTGEQLQLITAHQVIKTLLISDIPPLQLLIGTLRAVFAGDLATLRTQYQLTYTTQLDRWTLALTPRNPTLLPMLQRLLISGDGVNLISLEITEANADRRVLRMQLIARRP
ncbi:hypothetical protein HUU62_11880 [Rhodoferax sp. 4810]|uniref:Outer membrane lipoprotein carrier protein LolA n=1 Tax=Thiospirillum jenense TaxID=1653858 RepID=A0A839HIT7_9GAMM|nr:LolA-related protein [Thiospirillum jenense]MBB1075108.1 hypothetical protein [Rhodoferax jenense]MBB1126757.1 hypothetical protein [Thiospirillum jenense]